MSGGRSIDRRAFIGSGLALGATAAFAPQLLRGAGPEPKRLYRISLAQWSLHRTLRSGELDTPGFVRSAREVYGIEAVEYVNSFFREQVADEKYLAALRSTCEDQGVRSLLIMCDGLGRLGDPDEGARSKAIENHRPWLAAAQALGCHSIRVNAASAGTREEQVGRAADGLRRLTELGDTFGLNVIVENHGGLSSDGSWLAEVMRTVDHPRCGTLPDFGNFHLGGGEWYDRYRGIEELMPFAKAVSAKSHAFDEDGDETKTDYRRMMRLVLAAGYRGWVGIEFEGGGISEMEGIIRTKKLLEKVHRELLVSREFEGGPLKNPKSGGGSTPSPTGGKGS
ncbi:MAG: sugar phosphate isomerase/epimerase family protein [Planctomycetota bacterium]